MRLEDAGIVWTYPNTCQPLDELRIVFRWNMLSGQDVKFDVYDGDHKMYFSRTVKSIDKQAEILLRPGAVTGTHLIKVFSSMPGRNDYQRSGSFRVAAETKIHSGISEIDELFELLKDGLLQCIDVVKVRGRSVTYHKCGDNCVENLALPPFLIPAMRYFISDIKSVFEAMYQHQWPNGKLPDHIFGDDTAGWAGKKKIRSCMADLESGTVSMLYRAWQAHGDDKWVGRLITKMERGLEYVMSDPNTFDKKHMLLKRGHTLDEWDIQICGGSCFINKDSHFVISAGDAHSIYEACHLLSDLHCQLGNEVRSSYWRKQATHFFETGNKLFWDGVKYKHHIHLDKVDHADFDEDDQLVMTNTWAITRGFADHAKSVSIIDEYLRRQKATGDRFPWWSLQPGYPDTLNYFKLTGDWSLKQGEYANGGLFPWVGGELCRGAFAHGRESIGYIMLKDFHFVVKENRGAVFTWYDLSGNPGIVAPRNQTNYDMWGITPWVQALIEGLAGIESSGKLFNRVLCCPRWIAAGVTQTAVTAHFPASNAYFSYRWSINDDGIEILFTGTGEWVDFHILIPAEVKCEKVVIDGESSQFEIQTIEGSHYVNIKSEIKGTRRINLHFLNAS